MLSNYQGVINTINTIYQHLLIRGTRSSMQGLKAAGLPVRSGISEILYDSLTIKIESTLNRYGILMFNEIENTLKS